MLRIHSKKHSKKLLRSCSCIFVGFVNAAFVFAQSASFVPLSVSGSYPLAKAAEILERRHGLLVNYEDTVYTYAADIRDDADPKYRQLHPGAQALTVKGGQLDVTIPVLEDGRTPTNALLAIHAVVQAHNSAGLPGQFRVVQNGEAFFILPTAVKGGNGAFVPSSSPFDARITLPERDIDGLALVTLICDEVSRVSGVKVLSGTLPINLMLNKSAVIKANNETARDVLQRSLTGLRWKHPGIVIPGRKLAWQLLYSPNQKAYYFNLHVAMKEVRDPFFGRPGLEPQ